MFHNSTGLDDGSPHDNGILDLCTFFYLNTGEQDRMLYISINPAAVCDHTVLNDRVGADLMSGHAAVPAVDLPILIKEVDPAVLRIQNLHICLPEGRDRSDILPVSLKVVGVHFSSVLQKVRDNVVSEVVLGVRIRLVLDQVLL